MNRAPESRLVEVPSPVLLSLPLFLPIIFDLNPGKRILLNRVRAWYEAVLKNKKATHTPKSPLSFESTWSQRENRICFLTELSLTNCFSKGPGGADTVVSLG